MTSSAIRVDTSIPRPYTPSFIDRFMGFVRQMPYPYWLTYLILCLMQSSIFHVLAWMDGAVPAYRFSPELLLFPVWLWFPLAIMTYLNSVAREALVSFRPLLDIDDEQFRQLGYEFTTMPARGALLSSLFWASVYVGQAYFNFEAFIVSYGTGTTFATIIFLEGLVAYLIGSAIYYHSFRLLRLVNRTVKMVKQYNLFQLDPVYAFSRVTARTGIAWMIMLSFSLLFYPVELTNAPVLSVLVVQVALALAAFVLPLRFVNSHLVSEKRRLLTAHDQRVRATLERLHHGLDENELDKMGQLESALAGLTTEREILSRIPTWPWRAGTLTTFLSAIGLPVVLFLIQLVIERWLGG